MTAFDVTALRQRFPALSIEQDGRPIAFFDGPGGTQVPAAVIDAVARYYRESNANTDGAFLTSRRSDAIIADAHQAMADMLGAADAGEIKFGPNMTTLTFHISRSIAATMAPGDEIIVTGLDHHGNVDPWLGAARDRGLTVRVWEPRLDDCTLDLADLDALLGPRTKLVAVGWASNAVGTINPVAEIVRRAHAAGAWTYIDAVHAAPHLPIDVRAIDTDFLACSTYKFFGPHAGVLYGKAADPRRAPDLQARSPPTTGSRPAPRTSKGLAGRDRGGRVPGRDRFDAYGAAAAGGRRVAIASTPAMTAIRAYEMDLYRRLADGLEAIPGIRLYGITDRARFGDRTPTAALTLEGNAPRAISEALGRDGIATWDGDFYATGLIERLGLAETGGVVRIGLTHYNTADEVDRVVRRTRQDRRGRGGRVTGGSSAPDVAIVGGGIVGAATAAFLAARGATVTLYERTAIAAAASGRNSGVIQHPFDPVLVGLYRESLALYRTLAAESGAAFQMPAEPAGLLAVGWEERQAAGIAAGWEAAYPETRPEVLTGASLHALEPALAPDVTACRLAIGYPVVPAAATRAFSALAEAAGAQIRIGLDVGLALRGGVAVGVELDGRVEPAGSVVVAAGPWTPSIVDPSGTWRPIRSVWGVVADVRLAAPPRHVLEELVIDIEPADETPRRRDGRGRLQPRDGGRSKQPRLRVPDNGAGPGSLRRAPSQARRALRPGARRSPGSRPQGLRAAAGHRWAPAGRRRPGLDPGVRCGGQRAVGDLHRTGNGTADRGPGPRPGRRDPGCP